MSKVEECLMRANVVKRRDLSYYETIKAYENQNYKGNKQKQRSIGFNYEINNNDGCFRGEIPRMENLQDIYDLQFDQKPCDHNRTGMHEKAGHSINKEDEISDNELNLQITDKQDYIYKYTIESNWIQINVDLEGPLNRFMDQLFLCKKTKDSLRRNPEYLKRYGIHLQRFEWSPNNHNPLHFIKVTSFKSYCQKLLSKERRKEKYKACIEEVVCCLGKGAFGKVSLVKSSENEYVQKVCVLSSLYPVEIATFELAMLLLLSDNCFLPKFHGYFWQKREENISIVFISERAQCDLREYLRKINYKLSDEQIVFVIICVVMILQHLFRKFIIHRDIKPENLLVAKNGYLLLTNFKLCTLHTGFASGICGTPNYIAPEILLAETYGPAVDVWSCGVLLYEIMYGKPIYDQHDIEDYLDDVESSLPIHIPEHTCQIGRVVCGGFLCKKPVDRLGCNESGMEGVKYLMEKVNWTLYREQGAISPLI